MNQGRIAEMRAMAEAADADTAQALHSEIQDEIQAMQGILALVASKLQAPAAAPTPPPVDPTPEG